MMMGSETEFGIVGGWTLDKAMAIHAEVIRDRVCLPSDKEGVFLECGGRAYVDHGKHNEYATPEVESPAELVICELAGRALMAEGAAAAQHRLLCSNVDPVTRNRWGTHENYQCTKTLGRRALSHLYPHLVSRIVYTGAGGLDPRHPGVKLVLSPRACLLNYAYARQGHDCFSLVFAKPQPYCAGDRLHVFSGESLLCQQASYLKYATTALVVGCLDAGQLIGPGPFACSPMRALQRVNRDQSLNVQLSMADGRRLTALEIQEGLLAEVSRHVDLLPAWAPAAIACWTQTLQALRCGRVALAGQLDWLLFHRALRMLAGEFGFDETDIRAMNHTLAAALRDDPHADGPPRFRKFRDAAWELYVRLHMLGKDSLFSQFDGQGLLNHRIAEVTPQAVAAATREPPPGRPANRTSLIRKYRDQPDMRVSWSHLFDATLGRTLEIPSDRAWSGDESWSGSTADFDPQASHEQRRSTAHQLFRVGRYAAAERIYRDLQAQGFEPAGTHIHLARVMFVTGREAEARLEVAQAWELRAPAPGYVTSRALFFKVLLALLDGADTRALVQELHAHLQTPGAIDIWTIQPVLARFAPRLGAAATAGLTLLTEAITNQERYLELATSPAWPPFSGPGSGGSVAAPESRLTAAACE